MRHLRWVRRPRHLLEAQRDTCGVQEALGADNWEETVNDIEATIKEMFGRLSKHIPGGVPMKNLLVFICALVGGVVAYKWLKENLAKLLE